VLATGVPIASAVVDVTMGRPMLTNSTWPQVVLRPLEQLGAKMRDSAVSRYEIQRTVARPIDRRRRHGCPWCARHVSFEFQADMRNCAVDRHPHL
jgi:hypothetical protein